MSITLNFTVRHMAEASWETKCYGSQTGLRTAQGGQLYQLYFSCILNGVSNIKEAARLKSGGRCFQFVQFNYCRSSHWDVVRRLCLSSQPSCFHSRKESCQQSCERIICYLSAPLYLALVSKEVIKNAFADA